MPVDEPGIILCVYMGLVQQPVPTMQIREAHYTLTVHTGVIANSVPD